VSAAGTFLLPLPLPHEPDADEQLILYVLKKGVVFKADNRLKADRPLLFKIGAYTVAIS
jgi:hypothetical protein